MKNRIAITALNFLRACAVPMAMLVAVSLVAQTAPYNSAKPLPHATFTPDGREISPKLQSRTRADILQELHALGNGVGDNYQIDSFALPALRQPLTNFEK